MRNIYLVTGANGHLGFNVCLLLRSENEEVHALILPSDNEERLISLGVKVFKGDVTDISTLEHFFNSGIGKEVCVIHCAGIVSIVNKQLELLYKVNFEGTKNILSMFEKKHFKRMIYVSSVHAIPELEKGKTIEEVNTFDENLVVGEYAKSKALTSKYVLQKAGEGLNIVLVHPSGIIGPGDNGNGHLTMMVEDYLNGRLTSRVKGAYDFVDVRDVARGILSACQNGKSGECYILSGHRVDLNLMFETLRKVSGKKGIINVLPTWFARASAPLAEIYYKLRGKPPIYSKYSLHTIQSNAYFSSFKAEKELAYTKTEFVDTIKATAKWLDEQGRIKSKAVSKYIKTN